MIEARRSVLLSPYLWAFLIGIATLTLLRPLLRHEPAPPPVLARLPAWTLTAADGSRFGSEELAGRVYVASFFFTRCASICPLLMESLGRLERRYVEAGVTGVHLVSITVDPEHDTPERLRAYAEEHGIDPARWTLLTGGSEEIRRVVVSGFKTAMGEPGSDAGGLVDIAHTGKLALVDPSGGIRGYYDTDAVGLDEVFHRSRHVLKEAGARP